MKVRRDVASVPSRSAKETWDAIVDLVTGPGSVDAATLGRASSIMESLIADEHAGKVPIVLKGVGSRLVVYLSFGEDAVDAGTSIDPLTWNPTAGDWSMTAPADADDVGWMNETLKARAPRIMVHDVAFPPAEEDPQESSKAMGISVDWGALRR